MKSAGGFTLLELAVTIVILGILSSIALPAFTGMLADMRVRSTAESFNLGLQLARSEAIRRNSRVSFRFTSSGEWTVCAAVSTAVNFACPDVIQIRRSDEASKNVLLSPTPSASTMTTFTALGRQYTDASASLKNPDGTVEMTRIEFSATGGSKTYRVAISSSGKSSLCQPSLPAGNVKACL